MATFRSLVADRAEVIEVVDAELLARAADAGPASVADDVHAALAELRGRGADRIVCTCSTLGGLAESLGDGDVVRVDRPMARAAIADGSALSIVVALEATIEPTLALLAEEATAAGAAPVMDVVSVPAAWSRFLDGDHDGYLDTLEAAIREQIPPDHTVVLAQGSMAALVERFPDRTVLASPALAVSTILTELEASS